MDFTFTDDQLTFREAISRFLMTEAAPEMLREIWETDVGRSPDLRNKIAAQGLTALSVPEAEGGLGMDDVAWALMTQELGYYAIPDSLADTAYVATGLLTGLAADHPARANLLPRIAEGSLRLAISHPVNALVSDAQLAEVLILTDGDDIHLVPRSQVDVETHPSIDASRRMGRVTWNPTPATCIASGAQGQQLQARMLDRGALSVAGQLLGWRNACSTCQWTTWPSASSSANLLAASRQSSTTWPMLRGISNRPNRCCTAPPMAWPGAMRTPASGFRRRVWPVARPAG